MLTVPALIRAAIGRPRAHVAGPDAGVEAVRRVVGQRDRLVVAADPVDRHDRAEGLLVAAGHRRRDAVEHGRLVEVAARGPGARRPPASTVAPLAPASSTCAVTVVELRRRSSEPMSAPQSRPRRRAASPRTRPTNRSRNASATCSCDVQPLHRDAQLPGGGEAGADGALGRPVEVGVARRRTSRSCRRARGETPTSRRAARLGDLPPGRGRAGEADVVGALDDGLPDRRAVAEHDLQHVGRAARPRRAARRPAARSAAVCWSGCSTTALPAMQRGQRVARRPGSAGSSTARRCRRRPWGGAARRLWVSSGNEPAAPVRPQVAGARGGA